MKPHIVRMRVPRVVADLLGLLIPHPATAQEVTPVVHDDESTTIRQRERFADWLSDEIQRSPSQWGVIPEREKRHLFASRLLEMRNRVRACQIREAAEVAAL